MSEVVTLVNNLPVTKIGEIAVSLVEFEEASANLLTQAERAEITDEDTYAKGGDLISVAKNHKAAVEQRRKDLTDPLNKLVKFINGRFNPVRDSFDKVRSTIEPKMLAWKRAEDEKRAAAAREEAARIEQEALDRAAAEKSGEDQDKVLEEAGVAAEKIVEKSGVGVRRGMFGSTGSRKVYTTNVENTCEFLKSLIALHEHGEFDINAVVELRKAGLNNLAKYMLTERKKGRTEKIPGASFVETDALKVY